MTRPVVLLVDDDPGVRFTLREVLAEADVDVIEAENGLEALAQLERAARRSGDHRSQDAEDGRHGAAGGAAGRRDPDAEGRDDHRARLGAAAVEAMKLGAYDYFRKPFDVDEVAAVVKRATERGAAARRRTSGCKAELVLARRMVFRSEPA